MVEFKAKVRVLSHKGHGVIDHPDGRVFFARGTWPGDEGVFTVHEGAKSYDDAQVKSLTVQASERVEIHCPHQGESAGRCGGCSWMGISYEAQLKAKQRRVKFLLDKNGIIPDQLHPIIPSPKIWGYRNRAQFKTDGKQLGYVSEGTNVLAPIEDCLILNEEMRILLKEIKAKLPRDDWRPIGDFPWSYLEVDDQSKCIEVVPNRRRPFRQGNTFQNEAMKTWIAQAVQGVPKDWPVIEAFCGSGNFTEIFSQQGFSNILAAEVRGQAIQELKDKKLLGVRPLEIDMNQKNVWRQLAKGQAEAKVLLVDPPREGLVERRGMFEQLKGLNVFIYISCEPTTWSRDVKDFQQHGWRVAHLTPLDLFPHTPHVELMSLLIKSS